MAENQQVQTSAASMLQNLLDEERQKRIQSEQFAQALVEEFTSCSDFEEVRKKFRERVKDFAPQALINVIELANNAESESVRSSMNKWVLEWAMSDKIDNSGSELNELLSQLTKQDKEPQT